MTTLSAEWAGQTSEDRRATVLLRQEHELLLGLFRRQHEPPGDPSGGPEALEQRILDLVELIDRVERDVFFPALPSKYAPLVRAFEADHDALAGCIAQHRRNGDAAASKLTGERVEQLARAHLALEETLLYNAVERDHPELNRELYAALVAARARLARTGSAEANRRAT